MTRQLAEVLAATTWTDLPPATVEHARRAVLDWLGSALAGALEPPARMTPRVARGLGASAEATLLAAAPATAAQAGPRGLAAAASRAD